MIDKEQIAYPQQPQQNRAPVLVLSSWFRVAVVVCLLAFPSVFTGGISAVIQAPAEPLAQLPARLGEWHNRTPEALEWQPYFVGAFDEDLTVFRRGSNKIAIYRNIYVLQTQGQERVNQNNRLLEDSPFDILSEATTRIEAASGVDFEASTLFASDPNGNKVVVLYWYVVGHRISNIGSNVKLYELLQHLKGRAGSGVVALRADCSADSCEAELGQLKEFVRHHWQRLSNSVNRSPRSSAA